jgi:MFS family permease
VNVTSKAAGATAAPDTRSVSGVAGSGSGSGSRRRAGSPGLVLALTSVAFFMVSLDALVVVTALPAIHRSIGGAIGTLEWAVNAYSLTFAAGIITAAALGERLGRRRIYVSGLAVFTLASAACAVAPNASLLIAARAVQGLGAAAVTPLALTILAAAFPVERRGAVVGIFGGISGLAVAGGPLVGGAVTQGLDWHWIFWINVPFGVFAVIGSLLFLPPGRTHIESASGRTRLDVVGSVLAAGGAALLAWGLVRVGGSGWDDPVGLAGVLGGLGVLAGFVAWERRAASPMLPLRLFRVRTFAAANVTGFMSFGAIMAAAFLTAQYFQIGLGYSARYSRLKGSWGARPRSPPGTGRPCSGRQASPCSARSPPWPSAGGGRAAAPALPKRQRGQPHSRRGNASALTRPRRLACSSPGCLGRQLAGPNTREAYSALGNSNSAGPRGNTPTTSAATAR